MSSPDCQRVNLSRRGFSLGLPLLLSGFSVLGACGFKPLYKKDRADQGEAETVAELASIDISPIPDRTGQLLRNDLLNRLAPRGQKRPFKYRLDIALKDERTDLVVLKDDTSTFAKVKVTAIFRLTRLDTGEQLLKGNSQSVTSFNIVDSQYATISAEKGARERAVREISDDLRLRLGVLFEKSS